MRAATIRCPENAEARMRENRRRHGDLHVPFGGCGRRGDPASKPLWYINPKAGKLLLDGWHGRSETPVEVIGETPKRYRIRASVRTRLAGPNRYLDPGKTALVPKAAIKFDQS